MDIHQSELLKWLRQLVDHLINTRGMTIAALMRCKFLLAKKIENKIAAIRQKERSSSVYQQYLLVPEANTTISFDDAFTFTDNMYWDQRRYRGRWKPRKHFLDPDRVPAFDGADDGEEMQCAQVIDSLAAVKYWIRNVARHPNSFWLPTATDKFYPDFVALLNDGRLLVVEYKGAHIAETSDTNEKRTIGALWERSSDGKGLFIIAEQMVDGKDVRQQLQEENQVGANLVFVLASLDISDEYAVFKNGLTANNGSFRWVLERSNSTTMPKLPCPFCATRPAFPSQRCSNAASKRMRH